MVSKDMFRGIPWVVVFPYLCYEIWKDRNFHVFNSKDISPIQVISYRASGRARDHGIASSMKAKGSLVTPRFATPKIVQ